MCRKITIYEIEKQLSIGDSLENKQFEKVVHESEFGTITVLKEIK